MSGCSLKLQIQSNVPHSHLKCITHSPHTCGNDWSRGKGSNQWLWHQLWKPVQIIYLFIQLYLWLQKPCRLRNGPGDLTVLRCFIFQLTGNPWWYFVCVDAPPGASTLVQNRLQWKKWKWKFHSLSCFSACSPRKTSDGANITVRHYRKARESCCKQSRGTERMSHLDFSINFNIKKIPKNQKLIWENLEHKLHLDVMWMWCF